MYWEGPQLDRPDERPFASIATGARACSASRRSCGRATFIDWETLKTHIPVDYQHGLERHSLLGTDIAGFVADQGVTARFLLRWFSFPHSARYSAPRPHLETAIALAVTTGTSAPSNHQLQRRGRPTAEDLHNFTVEPIPKYLELRYRMLPYLYSAVRESTQTGLPIMRAMCCITLATLSRSRVAINICGVATFWWRLVVEPGATSRRVYLPKGAANANQVWYDFLD